MPEKNVLHKGTVSQISMFNKALDKAEKDDFCGIMISSDSYKTYGTEDDVFNALPGDVYMKKKIVDMADKGIMIPISLSSGSGFIEIDDIKAAIGQKASCTVDEIGGKAPYTYEWQEAKGKGEFKTITGLSGKDFALDVKTEHYENRYRCKVTDADGKTVYSNEFKIVPTTMIQTVFPEDVYANYGNYVTLRAGAVGVDGSIVTYKWRDKMATGREEDITSLDSAWAQGWDTPELEVFVEKDKFSHVLTFMCEMRDTAGNKIVTNAIGIKPEKPLVISQPSDTVKGSVGEWVKPRENMLRLNTPGSSPAICITVSSCRYQRIIRGQRVSIQTSFRYISMRKNTIPALNSTARLQTVTEILLKQESTP